LTRVTELEAALEAATGAPSIEQSRFQRLKEKHAATKAALVELTVQKTELEQQAEATLAKWQAHHELQVYELATCQVRYFLLELVLLVPRRKVLLVLVLRLPLSIWFPPFRSRPPSFSASLGSILITLPQCPPAAHSTSSHQNLFKRHHYRLFFFSH
jgi:hypothetical protein